MTFRSVDTLIHSNRVIFLLLLSLMEEYQWGLYGKQGIKTPNITTNKSNVKIAY